MVQLSWTHVLLYLGTFLMLLGMASKQVQKGGLLVIAILCTGYFFLESL